MESLLRLCERGGDGQPFNQPDTVSTPEEPHRRTPMIEQQLRSFDKTKQTTQQKLYFQQEYDKQNRNPSTALVLALLLGGLGAHRFYLRQMGWGVAYILFAWTFIPVLVSFVECFFIRSRTREYNERCAEDILTKMSVIFSEPEIAVTVR
jgi:TM2 domain-containing membrane protein YozV